MIFKKLHDLAYPIYNKLSHTNIEQNDTFAKLSLQDTGRPKLASSFPGLELCSDKHNYLDHICQLLKKKYP